MSPTPSDRTHLFLIGYRGTGKTTAARRVAAALGRDWLDADVVLEERHGRTIRQIFAEEGEAGFRDKEAALLAELCQRPPLVLATGGGAVLRPENRELLRRHGHVAWLTADAATIWRRLQGDATTGERRPNLTVGGLEEIQTLLRVREPLYRACADVAIDTAGRSPDEVVGDILASYPQG